MLNQHTTKHILDALNNINTEQKKFSDELQEFKADQDKVHNELHGLKDEQKKFSDELQGFKTEQEKVHKELQGLNDEQKKFSGELQGFKTEQEKVHKELQRLNDEQKKFSGELNEVKSEQSSLRQDMNAGFEKVFHKLDSHRVENINADNLLLNEVRTMRENIVFVNRKVADTELDIHRLKQNR